MDLVESHDGDVDQVAVDFRGNGGGLQLLEPPQWPRRFQGRLGPPVSQGLLEFLRQRSDPVRPVGPGRGAGEGHSDLQTEEPLSPWERGPC